jgi:nicotinate-nucleotide pyrophosphorylase (carboxylating)
MLDNFTIPEAEHAIKLLVDNKLRDQLLIEISGTITPENIGNYAKINVDIISLGYLTHSIKALDLALDLL